MHVRAFVALAVGVLTGMPVSAAESFAQYNGRELFARFCASCHGPAGFGDGPVAPALKVLVPDLTRLQQRHGGQFPAERVHKIIDGRELFAVHGSRYMPVWGHELWSAPGQAGSESESARRGDEVAVVIDRLVEYLRSIQQSPR